MLWVRVVRYLLVTCKTLIRCTPLSMYGVLTVLALPLLAFPGSVMVYLLGLVAPLASALARAYVAPYLTVFP
jgi:hypothetical protein